eukprot:gnl/TRDRNA2_/TRDRNA2_177097_c1_seq1.p1 gnl/TRDRNA2_/TRDRNA2_177097_c1~~gnl/TRDRNA2_/TRDRNA2_177097_c1_seq1.p1  ORF type:complete len:131 (+),score=0.14 gnl/TRDRNA2_/TRDRNA2_177097_c1_seq1:191-583(+)
MLDAMLEIIIALCQDLNRMEIAFSNKKLREICNNECFAATHLGPHLAATIQKRIADLAAARRASDLFFMPWISTVTAAEYGAIILVDLDDQGTLVCEPHTRVRKPLSPASDDIDWDAISRIKILEIRGPK